MIYRGWRVGHTISQYRCAPVFQSISPFILKFNTFVYLQINYLQKQSVTWFLGPVCDFFLFYLFFCIWNTFSTFKEHNISQYILCFYSTHYSAPISFAFICRITMRWQSCLSSLVLSAGFVSSQRGGVRKERGGRWAAEEEEEEEDGQIFHS